MPDHVITAAAFQQWSRHLPILTSDRSIFSNSGLLKDVTEQMNVQYIGRRLYRTVDDYACCFSTQLKQLKLEKQCLRDKLRMHADNIS